MSPPAGDGEVSRVFISSASGGLAPYRKAAVDVCHRLGLQAVHMDEFDPERAPPEEVCRRKVEGCDVFVLLLAHRYGSRPPGRQLSYTELEYRWAVNCPGMELLAFVVDPAFAWPPLDIDRGPDAEALAQFAIRVRTDHLVRPLAELTAFREDLMLALRKPRRGAWVPAAPMFHAMPPYVGGAPFTGRTGDLAVLDEWARSPDPVLAVEAIGGTGKSALTWQWTQEQAPGVVVDLAGRLWWSFYEGSASMTRFLQELLAYTSGARMRDIQRLERGDLADQALAALRSRRYLVVLDGFERLLTAYHRIDPSKVRDDEVESDKRSLIDPQAEEVVSRLAAATPSKILISTRLLPNALQSRFGQRLPGVRHLRLPGLTDADTRELLARLDVHGGKAAIAGFFGPLENHPLLVGIVAGLVRDYRDAAGDFDRWLADPAAGGALRVPDLDLTQRRTHILAAALAGLQPEPRRLLGWISVLAERLSWATLVAINPFQPQASSPAKSPSSRAAAAARKKLVAALEDLDKRGLLWWDRSSNSYDLHPIIRAYAYEQLEDTDRVDANDRIRDHFQALPPEDPARATSVEDLSQTITIFRALIGASHLSDARALWARFGGTLLIDLGSYATVTELLGPVADRDGPVTRKLRGDLAMAYFYLGRYQESIGLEARLLTEDVGYNEMGNVQRCLHNLAFRHREAGNSVAASRYLELGEAVNAATGQAADGNQYAARAEFAVSQGRVREARKLLDRAERFGPGLASPWFAEKIDYWRLYLALVAGDDLTTRQLDDATAKAHSWLHRRRLAELRCELLVRQGQSEPALAAAQEYEQLGRNAGLNVVPARSAFLLAKTGRSSEAAVAVEESLTRLHRIHPADQPNLYLARALWELGRITEAATQAEEAYRQAWRDGPPYCQHWDLRDARDLLRTMDRKAPDLPVVDAASVTVPQERLIRSFITALETKGDADLE
jgi:tetratricopeptide (TPR) repeat protein